MFFVNILGLLFSPAGQWTSIRDRNTSMTTTVIHILILAAIPAISGYIGSAHVGWQIGSGPVRFMTSDSAATIFITCYVALVACVLVLGRAIHWMATTYGSTPGTNLSLAIAAYSATPLFLAGFAGLYPSLWLFMLLGLLAIAHSVRLLYTGVPIMMQVSKEQGFVFSSAILTVGLVTQVGLMVVTILFWSFGMMPVFT